MRYIRGVILQSWSQCTIAFRSLTVRLRKWQAVDAKIPLDDRTTMCDRDRRCNNDYQFARLRNPNVATTVPGAGTPLPPFSIGRYHLRAVEGTDGGLTDVQRKTSILARLMTMANSAIPASASRRREAALVQARLARLSGARSRPVIEAEDVARRRWDRVERGAA